MIMVIVDRLSKRGIFIPTYSTITAAGTAKEIRDHLVAKHGFPRVIISNRGPQFASNFMKEITAQLGIQQNISTAYHPQTDGQTERVNQEIEQYLRVYVNY